MEQIQWNKSQKERERESTDEIVDIEGLVISPVGVVDTGVPAFVGANNVVSGGGVSEEEEDEDEGEEEEGGGEPDELKWGGHGGGSQVALWLVILAPFLGYRKNQVSRLRAGPKLN